MNIYYQNSRGETQSLSGWPVAIEDITPLFARRWDYDSSENINANVSRVGTLYRTKYEQKLTIQFFADTKEEYVKLMNHFADITEIDVLSKKPGRIYVNDYYLECFLLEMIPKDYEEFYNAIDNDVELTSFHPFWAKEILTVFTPHKDVDETEWMLDYPHDYDYDYWAVGTASMAVDNPAIYKSEFIIQINGAADNPAIEINGHIYRVDHPVGAGEVLEIRSTEKTITLIRANGERLNLFNYRNKEFYIFEKIPSGINIVHWNGSFEFELTLLEKRSEPKWI